MSARLKILSSAAVAVLIGIVTSLNAATSQFALILFAAIGLYLGPGGSVISFVWALFAINTRFQTHAAMSFAFFFASWCTILGFFFFGKV